VAELRVVQTVRGGGAPTAVFLDGELASAVVIEPKNES
jgi:hypothetical protein